MTTRLRLLSRLALILLILVAMLAWNLRTPTNDLQAEMIRQQGYPITLTELDSWYDKVPDNQNAALLYTNAFAKLTLASNAFYRVREDAWVPKRGQPIVPEDNEELAAIFATNREVMDLLFSAAALTNCRYPIDLTQSFTIPFPHLAHLREAA